MIWACMGSFAARDAVLEVAVIRAAPVFIGRFGFYEDVIEAGLSTLPRRRPRAASGCRASPAAAFTCQDGRSCY